MACEETLSEMGLVLPEALKPPPGVVVKWRQVRVVGTRAVIAGHGPRHEDGTYSGPFGKVGLDLTPEQGYDAARLTALGILGDLRREIGDLDRVLSWTRVFGMVNSAPGFTGQAGVIDGFTDVMIELWGPDAASCPRAVVGVAELAFGMPVIIEAEVELRPS